MDDELSVDDLAQMPPREFARWMVGRPMGAHRLAREWATTRSARHQDETPVGLLCAMASWLLMFIDMPSMLEPSDPPVPGGGF